MLELKKETIKPYIKMKKRKLKNYLKLGILFLGISFLLWNCEKEDNLFSHDESSLINHNSHSRYVTVDEIPSVIKFLEQKTSNHLGHASKNDSENTIAFDEIIEVIDTLQGNKNYTFNITNIQQYVNNQISLYNLIVSTDSLGNAEEPYVLKYTLDKDFAIDYIKGIKTISEFKGEIAIVSVETFLANHTSYTSRNSICPEEPIFSNTNPGSGGGTTGGNGTSNPTGSTPSCSWVETGQYLPCGCGGNADGHAPSGPSCCAGSVAITTFQCNYTPNKSTSKTDDSGCPEPTEGNVAVLLGIDYHQALIEIMEGHLTESQIEWLSVQEYTRLERNMVVFLGDNDNSIEAIEFVKEIIRILENEDSTDDEKFNEFSFAYDVYDPPLDISASQVDFEARIKEYAKQFRRRGQAEFANYLESIIPFDPSTTIGEVLDVFEVIRAENKRLFYEYFREITITTIASFEPVVKLALVVVGGRLALTLLQNLPSAYITVHLANVITRLGIPASTAFTAFQHAQKFGIQTYAQLQQIFVNLGLTASGQGVQFHHLIEQRFSHNTIVQNWLGANTANWSSIVLTPEEHQVFTNAWRAAISTDNMLSPGWTGAYTNNATLEQVKEAARIIYANYPEILEALGL